MKNIPYGTAPINLGEVKLNLEEMMFYLYLPIKLRCTYTACETIPKRLQYIEPLISKILLDAENKVDMWRQYVYVTAKTIYVEGNFSGNRPGWHVDGFGSHGDLNYIWYNMNPTEFAVQEFGPISTNDAQSMIDMTMDIDHSKIRTYPNEHLLMLDESVVHRVNPVILPGIRTFIKVSISEHEFNLKGNSRNYLLDYNFNLHDRVDVRNMDCNKDFIK